MFDVTKISIGQTHRGWILYDGDGPIAGPYGSEAEAKRALSEWEREEHEAKQQELGL